MFTLTHDVLVRICERNRFPVPTADMVFAGLRGAVMKAPLVNDLATAVELEVVDVDYLKPRCTILQWRPGDRLVAAFPGSTVPHRSAIDPARSETFNQIFTGFYAGAFKRGHHHQLPSPTAHEAFVEAREFMILRTADDTTFDATTDQAMKDFPSDNLHAAWCSLDNPAGKYASVGCQVVVGFPETLDHQKHASGPWKTFKDRGYAAGPTVFDYLLVEGREAAMTAGPTASGAVDGSRRLRFGSQGPEVSALQTALVGTGDFLGRPDGDFGPQTILALIAFQRRVLAGTGSRADGIADAEVFAALKLPA